MVSLKATKKTVELAKDIAARIGVLRNSIINENGNFYSALSELAVLEYLKPLGAKKIKSYDYDLNVKNKKIEVKSQVIRVNPSYDYLVGVNSLSLHQRPDYYIFTMYFNSNEDHYIYLMAYSKPDEFFSKSKLYKAGDKLETNGHVFKNPIHLCKIKELNEIEKIKGELNGSNIF